MRWEFHSALYIRSKSNLKKHQRNPSNIFLTEIEGGNSSAYGPQCAFHGSSGLADVNCKDYDFDVQPIPPRLEYICSKDSLSINHTSISTLPINTLRDSINISIPYSVEELRLAANKSVSFSTAHTYRNRSEFYTADPYFSSHNAPILMDGFTYCDGSTLFVEAIFNLRYLHYVIGNEKKIESMKDIWICIHHGMTAQSYYPLDPHNHIIIAVFNFTNQCLSASDHHYEFRSVNTHYYYSLDLEFLPYYHVQRYYLSMCIYISKAFERQVIAFLNYYYFHGIQHFVFNINGNLEYWQKLLKVYSDHGIVDIVDFVFPESKRYHDQQVIMNSCNRRYRYTTQFMIHCDVDEFLLPLNPNWRIVDVVRLYSSSFPNIDGFSVGNDRSIKNRYVIIIYIVILIQVNGNQLC